MKYRNFSSTDLKVSEIGFGTWGIGGNLNNARAYGPTDDNESIAALNEAFECGVNFFDTSPLYGYGHSEELIGKTLQPYRDKIIIVTKVGYTDFSGKQDFSSKYIKDSLEKSLKRLKTDYVDIFQLHDIPIELNENLSKISETLFELRKEGKLRFIGISKETQEDSIKIIDKNLFDCMEINFSLVDQRANENVLFQKCQEREVAIIGTTPLCFGFLTGNYNSKITFHKDDHRKRWSKEQINLWSSAYKLFLKKFNNENRLTSAQISLRFCLSFPEISTIIPGMLTKEHVRENILSSELGGYSKEIINKFKKIYSNNNFFIKSL